MNYSPVIIFAYNRAGHFERTFEALSKCEEAKYTQLYIFSDGSPDEANDAKVAEVRMKIREAAKKNVFSSVNVTEAKKNKGLAASVISGVTQVLNEYGRVIVIEDDCICSPYFLKFMNACLEKFESDKSVGSIAGFLPIFKLPKNYDKDIFLAYRSCSCGWATWSDRWENVDWEMKNAKRFVADAKLRKKLNSNGSDRFLRYYRQSKGIGNSWSIRFGVHHVLNGYTVVYPTHSYIENIGADGSGVHTSPEEADSVKTDIKNAKKDFVLDDVTIDKRIQKSMKRFYSGGITGEMKKAIKTKLTLMKDKRK